MSIRILCTGDIHLGRRSSRIPQTCDTYTVGPRGAWHSFVNCALELQVDAAVLTGDVVDESNKFYEAFSILQSGVERLVKGGIPIFAASGNHDCDVLPRLADRIDEFHLLGRGGRWEEVALEQEGASVLRLQGWSFPAPHVSGSPLKEYVSPSDDLPTVGILHCDCDVTASPYAPVTLAELKAKAPDAWLLGHIHKAQILSDSLPLILYPGSPQGLDPSEQGPHGAWLITMESGRPPTAEILPLAGLRWEEIDVPLDALSSEESIERTVIEALHAKHNRIRDEITYTKYVGCRLCLRGRTPVHRRLPSLVPDMQANLRLSVDDIEYFVEKVEDLSQPDLSLEDIARSRDPAGLIAQRLILLKRREPLEAYQDMIRKVGNSIEECRSSPVFASLPDSAEQVTDERVRAALMKAGLTILDSLLAQKEARG